MTIIEKKTKKKNSKTIPLELLRRLAEQCGIVYCFEGRDDYRKHRTRQAVFIDLKKSAKRFKININLSPHSLRKNYAVYLKQQGKTIEQIQKELNHDNLITTLIYVMSDELNSKYRKRSPGA
jgi:site-specific recombinase XerD